MSRETHLRSKIGADTPEVCLTTPDAVWKGEEWLRKDVHLG